MINLSLAEAARLSTSAANGEEIVAADGTRLAVRVWGKGRPVLCLHAAGHGSGDFAAFAARLERACQIVALDWPGQGASQPDAGPVTAARYAGLALDAMTALGLERPVVLGCSIGGAAAILAAHRAPDRIAGLVLSNPGGLAPLDALARRVIGVMAACHSAGARGAAWYPAWFAAYYRSCVLSARAAARQRARIVAAGPVLAPLLAQAWRGFGGPDADIRAQARGLRVPVWLAWARRDPFVQWRRSRAAALAIPHRTVTLFPASHAPFLECPDRFAEGFRDWLAALPA